MPTIITIPASLDERSFEQVLAQLPSPEPDETLVFDARRCTFTTAYGLPALFALAQTRAGTPTLLPPEDRTTLRYWTHAGFIRFAEDVFSMQRAVSQTHSVGADNILFRLTSVAASNEAQHVVDRIRDRAHQIFTSALSLELRSADELATSLAELCKPIVKRTNHTGWAMMQACRFKKRFEGRPVAIIAVCDTSAERRTAEPWHCAWDGGTQALDDHMARVDGKRSMRSGTSRRCLVPAWDDDVPSLENLASFPGAQIQMIIPGRVTA